MVLRRSHEILVALVTVLIVGSAGAEAQEYALFDGAWIHAGFIQELKNTSSVPAAMKAVGEGEPFWVEIDSASTEGVVQVGFGFGDQQEWIFRKTRLHGNSLYWVIGTNESPQWAVTIDERTATYIALYDVGDLGGTPIVLGRLPAERQQADFLLERIINAAVLYGAWRDEANARYQFGTNMTGEWKGASARYRVDVEPTTHNVLLTVEHASGRSETYKAERVGSALQLTSSAGTILALTAEGE